MNPAIIELTAPDISCAKCKDNIEGDLAGDPGIQQVNVDVGARRVRIACGPDASGLGGLKRAGPARADGLGRAA